MVEEKPHTHDVYAHIMADTPQSSQLQSDWDMSPYFPGVDTAEYKQFCNTLGQDITSLASDLADAPALEETSNNAWCTRLTQLEDINSRASHLVSYLDCLGSANSRDEAVKRESGKLATTMANLDKLFVMVRAVLGESTSEVFESLLATSSIADVRYFVERLRKQAQQSMTANLESLSAELSVDGISAWGRLYDQVSGTLEFELDVPGQDAKTLPVSMTRSLLEDADPAVRKAAFDGSAVAWHQASDTLAACLNSIAGTRHTLYNRRGIEHYLEPALFDAGICRETLDCMLDVVRSRQKLPQAYLKRKAQLLGKESLGFHDLMAPLADGGASRVSWQGGAALVQSAFDQSYPALGKLAKRAFDERWIDYNPRPGKRPGGFCSTSHLTGQSRIFMTFNGGMGDVQTLAHELGHTFHSYLMRDMRPWAADYPMTLAETASTFAENLVTSAAIEDPQTSKAHRIRILDQRLQDSTAFLLNTPMRFDFECAFYEARKQGELSVEDLKTLMIDAQKKNYGDSLNPAQLDPWFWASKLHFYITEISFYNFPYTFGYLFSLGIFARFLQEGASFLPTYEKLLMQTGSAPAEDVAKQVLGVDLTRPEFWNASIDLVERDWNRYQELL